MELDVYLRFVLALLFVLGLIGGLTLLARRFGFGGRMIVQAGKQQRLSISEVRPLDARHKLVLVCRDATEHLILIGPTGGLLIESGIPAAALPGGRSTPASGATGGDVGQ